MLMWGPSGSATSLMKQKFPNPKEIWFFVRALFLKACLLEPHTLSDHAIPHFETNFVDFKSK